MSSRPNDPAGDSPRAGQPERPRGDRLEGWKAIASYLGRDIRTVQRWELSERLPIHRLEHKQRATAYAFSGELDQWMAAREPMASGPDSGNAVTETASRARLRLRVALVLAGVALVGVIAFGTLRAGPRSQTADTRDPEAYSAFAEGVALYGSRQYRDAAIALERAVSRDPSYGLAWAWLSKTYGRLSQPMWAGGEAAGDRARAAAERAASLAPGIAEPHIALALAARARSDVDVWRAEASRAMELDPRAAEAIALLGDSYSAYVYACDRDQDPERAESYYRQALELKPDLITAASNRGHNLRRLRRYRECIDLMNRMIKAFPDETPLIAERGACRLLAGDAQGATQDLLPLRNNPKIAPAGALVYLGLLELILGPAETGISDLEAVLRLDASARAELVVAEAYGLAGEVSRAIPHLQRAFDLDRSCAEMVDTARAFAPIRTDPEVSALLARYGVR